MRLEIMSVNVTSALSKNGKTYQLAEVIFKDLFNGEVKSKKVLQFDGAFKVISKAKTGEQYNVTATQKGNFWNWDAAELFVEGTTPPTNQPTSSKAPQAYRSYQKTPEDEAKRQVMICAQSSLQRALELLRHNKPKEEITIEEAISVAKEFVQYVVNSGNPPIFSDLHDDIPE